VLTTYPDAWFFAILSRMKANCSSADFDEKSSLLSSSFFYDSYTTSTLEQLFRGCCYRFSVQHSHLQSCSIFVLMPFSKLRTFAHCSFTGINGGCLKQSQE
ncbi:hypothetical protein Sango_2893500, partial [Sesamum angolense]